MGVMTIWNNTESCQILLLFLEKEIVRLVDTGIVINKPNLTQSQKAKTVAAEDSSVSTRIKGER